MQNMKSVENTRRELFESAVKRDWLESMIFLQRNSTSGYADRDIDNAWWAFNAALDSVLIELPSRREFTKPKEDSEYWEDAGFNRCRAITKAGIESTNLGLKVE